MLFGLWVSVFLLSFMLTGCYRGYALRKSLLDIPNDRSSHQVPTPRGGGIAIVVSLLLGMGVAISITPLGVIQYSAFLLPGLLLAGVSYLDDLGHVKAGWRLLVQILSATLALYLTGGMTALGVFGVTLESPPLLSLWALLVLVWIINLYNFMDGINGIASLTAISISLGILVLLWLIGAPVELMVPPFLLAGASAGFLLWNFPRARIFMGDIGSCFIGLVLGVIFLQAGQWNPVFYWAVLILSGAFIVDASLTLLLRAWRRQKLYQAHREHAYQHLSRRWQSHTKVTLGYNLLTLGYLLPVAGLVVLGHLDGFMGLLLGYCPLALVFWRSGAGRHQQWPAPERPL